MPDALTPSANSSTTNVTPSTNTSSASGPSDSVNDSYMKSAFIAGGIFLVLFVAFVIWYVLSPEGKKPTDTLSQLVHPTTTSAPVQTTTVSGTVEFAGYASGDAYIAIAERAEGLNDFKDVVSGLTPTQGPITWKWSDAVVGANYEIKATLKIKGQAIESSTIQKISAPATGVVLDLVSEQQPPAPTTVTVSGQVNVDGYIPSGATIEILEKPVSSSTYTTVVSGLGTTDNIPWSWNGATAGTTYHMKARLKDASGNVLSNLGPITVTAPSSSVTLDVSSSATPPAPQITGVSGTITINGNVPSGAYITLGTRVSGTSTFNQVASNISASSGVVWTWNGANSGTSYDVQAYLWSNNQPYAQSQILTVVAPSANNSLIINAQQALQAPSSSTINVSCSNQSGNNYQASINFNTAGNLPNPQQFNLLVTLASTGQQVVNTTVAPGNPTQPQSINTTYVLQQGVTYYAQYSYAQCTNCSTFSAMSPAVQFTCN